MTDLAERIGCQQPTHSRMPADMVDPELGLIAVAFARDIGYELHQWQEEAIIAILTRSSKVVNWKPRIGDPVDVQLFAARDAVIEMPRQNGKNVVLEVIELTLLFLFSRQFRLVIHSAHRGDTVHEHFLRLKEVIESNRSLMEKMPTHKMNDGFTVANGKESIELGDGARILFKTRSTGGKVGKGTSPEVVVFDEAFDLSPDAIGALAPATSAQPNPLFIFTSSAPRKRSHVLHGLLKRCRSSSPDPRLLYLGWGSDPEVDLEDVDNWYRCNPSLGLTKYEPNITADRKLMEEMPGEFEAEHLGIPQEEEADEFVIPLEKWDALLDNDSKIATKPSIALVVADDRQWASFGVAGRRKDNLFHVQLAERRPGVGWVVDFGVEIATEYKVPIRIETRTPAAAYIEMLREAGVEVVEVGSADHAEAYGILIDAVNESRLVHPESRSLRAALKGAVNATSGDAVRWSLRRSRGEVTPLVAVTLALGGVPKVAKKKLSPKVLVQ